MILFVKNMLTPACKTVVKQELENLGLTCGSIEYGKVETLGTATAEQLELLNTGLSKYNLYIVENRQSVITERIKAVIADIISYSPPQFKTNFSIHLSKELSLDYTYMANVFSETEGITIEHYLIKQRIERVKQLISYGEMTLTQISWKLDYSSVAHLSTQFKKHTGITPSHFRQVLRPPLSL